MRSPWRRALRQPSVIFALVIIFLVAVGGTFAAQLAPHDPSQIFNSVAAGPSQQHWFGTDELGRDVFSRILHGAGAVTEAVLRAIVFAVVIGVPLGMYFGYRSGVGDSVLMRAVDVLLAIPGIVLALAVIAVLGPGLESAMLAVGIGFAARYARLSRGLVMSAKENLYVDAAKVGGANTADILGRHILPNVAGPLLVQTALFAGTVVLIEAALSFIGVGLPPNEPSWGGMLNSSRVQIALRPWLPVAPGVVLAITVLAFTLLGDGLRDALGRAGGGHHLSTAPRPRRSAVSASAIDGPATMESSEAASGQDRAPLSIEHLEVRFPGVGARPDAVILDDVNLSLEAGETLGLVGESGSGKTMTALAVMGLLPLGGMVSAGSIHLHGTNLVGLDRSSLRARQGREVAMIFQEPMAALNPAMTIGKQIAEPLLVHTDLTRRQAAARAVELLADVGISDPTRRVHEYPHQFSGGMAQRVMIAMALANDPDVLVADEPTTALDVTVQSQIVELLRGLQAERGMAILFITHDLGLVADACDRGAVMYSGQIVETGTVEQLFGAPQHPYTRALLDSMPRHGERRDRLSTIEGRVPPATDWPAGCRFAPRCGFAEPGCQEGPIVLMSRRSAGDERSVRCLRVDELGVAQP
jgi:peptide/nickel transport system permease protein